MTKATKAVKAAKMTVEEFVLRCIEKLANPDYNSIHVVISGANRAFTEYYGYKPFEQNPDGTVKRDIYSELAEKGVIKMHMVKKGPVIWKPDTEPNPNRNQKTKDKKKDSSKLTAILS